MRFTQREIKIFELQAKIVVGVLAVTLFATYAVTNWSLYSKLADEGAEPIAAPTIRIEAEPKQGLHPAATAGIVEFLETANAVGAAAEAYENPDGDGAAYQVDVPLGLVYEEALPSFVLSP